MTEPLLGDLRSLETLAEREEDYFLGLPISAQILVLSGTAQFLTVPGLARAAIIEAQGGSGRYTVDGTAVAATTGHRLRQDMVIKAGGREILHSFQAVNETGQSTTLFVTFYD